MSHVLCTWDIARKSQAFPLADGRHITIPSPNIVLFDKKFISFLLSGVKHGRIPMEVWFTFGGWS